LFAVENFARSEGAVQEVVAEADAQAVGVHLKELNLPRDVRIGLISTESHSVIPGRDAHIRTGDRVTLLGERNALENVKRMFEHKAPPRISVIIGGGGQVGYNLARHLQKRRCNVMIMESDERRCQYLSEKLDESVTVLHADVTRRSKMEEARVGKADVFVAATGHDEDNIVCGVEARELGSRRILSIVRRPDYANVLEKLGIDLAVSPREVMGHQILGMLQAGPILTRSTIAGGDAEIWEVEVQASAPITGAALREFDLGHALIAAIDREEYVRVPGADDKLIAGDTVVVLVQKDNIKHVAELFDVPRKHRP
ncbi:MAG: NAD-binding protein, partial [Planctomycetaceae bacterium]